MECVWNGVLIRPQHSTAKPSVAHPLDGIRNNRTLRWAVVPLPTVYHMEGSAIGAKGVHGFCVRPLPFGLSVNAF